MASLNSFERYLTLWVLLCIVIGIGLGRLFPGLDSYMKMPLPPP